jgi:hypothetical protein
MTWPCFFLCRVVMAHSLTLAYLVHWYRITRTPTCNRFRAPHGQINLTRHATGESEVTVEAIAGVYLHKHSFIGHENSMHHTCTMGTDQTSSVYVCVHIFMFSEIKEVHDIKIKRERKTFTYTLFTCCSCV